MIKIYYNRKSVRLKKYDYSQNEMYYVTICTHNREEIFSKIEPIGDVGAGLDSAHNKKILYKNNYTSIGKIIKEKLIDLEDKFPIKIEAYIIMPNHIHFIISFCKLQWNGNEKIDIQRAETCSVPTLGDIICTFKSITSIEFIKYNKQIGQYKKLWQRNYYEHIIRNKKEYYKICQYIKNNPINYIRKNINN